MVVAVITRSFWELDAEPVAPQRARSMSEPCLRMELEHEESHCKCCNTDRCDDSASVCTDSGSCGFSESSWSCRWADEEEPSTEHRTTVILSRLPTRFCQDDLLQLLDSAGFRCKYGFVYMPTDFKKGCKFGYATVDYAKSCDASRCIEHFSGLMVQDSRVSADWSATVQGLDGLVARYRNSAVMHPEIEPAHKPLLLQKGVVLPFPAPTEPIFCPARVLRSAASFTTPAPFTTLLVRGLQGTCTRSQVLQKMQEAFLESFDFLYVPMDFKKGRCFGYALVNFVDNAAAEHALAHMSSLELDGVSLSAEWSKQAQGFPALVKKYRDSPVMQEESLEPCRPLVLRGGVPVAFPC